MTYERYSCTTAMQTRSQKFVLGVTALYRHSEEKMLKSLKKNLILFAVADRASTIWGYSDARERRRHEPFERGLRGFPPEKFRYFVSSGERSGVTLDIKLPSKDPFSRISRPVFQKSGGTHSWTLRWLCH